MMRGCVVLTLWGAGLFAAAAHAQPYGAIHQSWQLTEVYAGTTTPVSSPNGILEPGEGMMFSLTVSFDPPVGTIVHAPNLPPGGAPVAGLSLLVQSIRSTGGGEGMWSNVHRRPEFAVGLPGWPIAGGIGWEQMRFGQITAPGFLVDPSNPITDIWRGVWTPESYEERTVEWLYGFSSAGFLAVEVGTDPGTGAPLYSTVTASVGYDTIGNIAIVPAPAGAGVLCLAGVLLLRRRRG